MIFDGLLLKAAGVAIVYAAIIGGLFWISGAIEDELPDDEEAWKKWL